VREARSEFTDDVFEAFQSLEDQVFRLDGTMSAASFKHSTAHVLHELGLIASPPQPHGGTTANPFQLPRR